MANFSLTSFEALPWPAGDPPLRCWFQPGKMTPLGKEIILFVTLYTSGWCQFEPAHCGLKKLYSAYCPKHKKALMDKGKEDLFKFYNLPMGGSNWAQVQPCLLE